MAEHDLSKFLRASSVLSTTILPSTKEQRQYLVNKLCHDDKNISYKQLLQICSDHFGGRVIKDIAELNRQQVSAIIDKVKNMKVQENDWKQYR
jgi:ppGpp synthetase/RelA/SpoT-type nucleotidyltranferase